MLIIPKINDPADLFVKPVISATYPRCNEASPVHINENVITSIEW